MEGKVFYVLTDCIDESHDTSYKYPLIVLTMEFPTLTQAFIYVHVFLMSIPVVRQGLVRAR